MLMMMRYENFFNNTTHKFQLLLCARSLMFGRKRENRYVLEKSGYELEEFWSLSQRREKGE